MLKAEHSTFSSGIGFDKNENIIVETVITIVFNALVARAST